VLAYTGIRRGEVVGLRVREVEFLRRLSVSQNAVHLGVRHTVGPTKGRSVTQFVLDELSIECRGKRATIWCSRVATQSLPAPTEVFDRVAPVRCETCRGREDHAAGEWRPAIAARYR
jgi:hypothetical protein